MRKNKFKLKGDKYLDLTSKEYLTDKKWYHLNFINYQRKYKTWALCIAITIAALGILPFLPFFVTIPLSIKFLTWVG